MFPFTRDVAFHSSTQLPPQHMTTILSTTPLPLPYEIMPSQQDELAAARARAEGIPIQVPDIRQITPSSPRHDAALQAMLLEAAEKGNVDVVRQCLARGAEISYKVITAATGSDEVFKVLVTEGGLDVNYDLETGGDMLINAVWERNVRSRSIFGPSLVS